MKPAFLYVSNFQFRIDESHIRNGHPNHLYNCALSLALRDFLHPRLANNDFSVSTNPDHIFIRTINQKLFPLAVFEPTLVTGDKDTQYHYDILFTKKLTKLIDQFDTWGEMRTCTIILHGPRLTYRTKDLGNFVHSLHR